MRLDFATIVGLVLGFLFIGLAIALGGNVAGFINPPSVLIVIGGTFAITTVCFTIPEVVRAQSVILQAITFRLPDESEEVRKLLALAQKARVNGLLSIQADLDVLAESFAQNAFLLAIDGVNPESIRNIMLDDTASLLDRHERGIAVLKKSAELAPAMGLIGTLIGLVQMLGNLADPNAIGPAMAVALLTTLYGAMLANMVFMPLAAKLERNSVAEADLRRLYTTAVLSVVRQENPRQLEVMLNAILPPAKRVTVFD